MDINDLHYILRQKTIINCELPEEDIVKLDEEIKQERDKNV